MQSKPITLTLIGCTGHITSLFLNEFYKQDIKLRVLTSKPEKVSPGYPEAEFIKGSMTNPDDVAEVMRTADAAFVCTPMGLRNDKSLEVAAGKSVIEAAKKVKLKHLIYVSVLGVDKPLGLSIFDAKYEVEQLIAKAGVPHTIIRCGSYMEDVFVPRLSAIKKGTFLFPIKKERVFTYTPQQDIARFVVEELLQKENVLNAAFNFTSPGTFRLDEVTQLLSKYVGRKVKNASPSLLIILSLLMPYFNWRNHRFSTIIPLLHYFNKHGYTAAGKTTADLFPNFQMTGLETYFQNMLNEKQP